MENKEIRIVYSPKAGQVVDLNLSVLTTDNVFDIIKKAGLIDTYPELNNSLSVGIYNQKVTLDTIPRNHDRIEIYRELVLSPTELRKLRARKKQEQ